MSIPPILLHLNFEHDEYLGTVYEVDSSLVQASDLLKPQWYPIYPPSCSHRVTVPLRTQSKHFYRLGGMRWESWCNNIQRYHPMHVCSKNGSEIIRSHSNKKQTWNIFSLDTKHRNICALENVAYSGIKILKARMWWAEVGGWREQVDSIAR